MKKLKLTFANKSEQEEAEKMLIMFRFDHEVDETSNDIVVAIDEDFEQDDLERKLERMNFFPEIT